MTLYQLVSQELKRGDIQKIADKMGVSHPGAASVLKNENFDSVKYLLAVCEVTGKPIEYFLKAFEEYNTMAAEPYEQYGFNSAQEAAKQIKELREAKENLLQELNSIKSDLIDALRKK